MNPMKRLGLAALLVAGVTLLASTPAQAKVPKGEDWGTIPLKNVGDEPQASGEATLTDVNYHSHDGNIAFPHYSGTLTVRCWDLTPGETYLTQAGTLSPSRKIAGEWVATGKVEFFAFEPYTVYVWRLDAEGFYHLVLAGAFPLALREAP